MSSSDEWGIPQYVRIGCRECGGVIEGDRHDDGHTDWQDHTCPPSDEEVEHSRPQLPREYPDNQGLTL